jgi:hypothetical protein
MNIDDEFFILSEAHYQRYFTFNRILINGNDSTASPLGEA